MDQVHAWKGWLSTLPKDQFDSLIRTMTELGYARASRREIPVISTPVSELYVPPVETYEDVYRLLPLYEKLAFNRQGNLIIKGPKGVGKSLSVRTFLHHKQIPLVVLPCTENTKDTHLLGMYTMVAEETAFVLGCISQAFQTANEVGRCALLAEEFNALTPQTQKTFNECLQERRAAVPTLGRTFSLSPGAEVWFVGTMNPSIYGGTYDLNEDLKSRMGEVEVGYPEFAQEKTILKRTCPNLVQDEVLDLCIRLAMETRQAATSYALSTRDVVRLVSNIATIGIQDALQLVICKFEGEDKDTVKKRLESVFASIVVKKTWGGN